MTASRAAALTPPDSDDAESAARALDPGTRLHPATATFHPQGEPS
ncbi:hypothetical protein ACGFX2_38735 [Streptomyces goshikiensis]